MNAAQAIDLCRDLGVTLEVESSDKLTVNHASRLTAEQLDTLRQLKPAIISELTRSRPTVRHCETCGELAAFGIGAMPWRGIEGRWFCFDHKLGR